MKEYYNGIIASIAKENPKREGLLKTPSRAANAMAFLTSGYEKDTNQVINEALFESRSDGIVISKNIEFYSLCEHHLLPFFGKCHIGYIPSGKILGISKMSRIVDIFAHRLQVQEELTTEIAHALFNSIKPLGVGIVIEAKHLCMMMRGVQKQDSVLVTSCLLGTFLNNKETRAEFLTLLNMNHIS